jgi:DNA-binding NarL/FixJ family response regulator
MSIQRIRVALADDQRLLREGLRIILETTPDMELVGEAEDGIEAAELATAEHPDVLLMDIRMPRCDGIAATEAVRQASPQTRVLLLTTFDTPDLVVEGLRAGAAGYLLKDCSAEELRAAVRAVARGQVLLQAQSAAQLLAGMAQPTMSMASAASAAQAGETGRAEGAPQDETRLTDREREVLSHIAQGYTNTEIAGALVVSETTVKTHVHHLLSKLGARDRAQAIVLARQRGLA